MQDPRGQPRYRPFPSDRGTGDTLDGLRAPDTPIGGRGADEVVGGRHGDVLQGGDGADTLNGDEGDDRLFGGSGPAHPNGGEGTNTRAGGAGPDEFALSEIGVADIRGFEVGLGAIVLAGVFEDLVLDPVVLADSARQSGRHLVLEVEGLSLAIIREADVEDFRESEIFL